jgi:hypothetical protein
VTLSQTKPEGGRTERTSRLEFGAHNGALRSPLQREAGKGLGYLDPGLRKLMAEVMGKNQTTGPEIVI